MNRLTFVPSNVTFQIFEKDLNIKPITPTKEKVAIVGTGPAGLTIAYFLAKKGYDVTIFESMPYPGGTLRFGISGI